jgi:hypothetical protein
LPRLARSPDGGKGAMVVWKFKIVDYGFCWMFLYQNMVEKGACIFLSIGREELSLAS